MLPPHWEPHGAGGKAMRTALSGCNLYSAVN
jgi:hypothetical protein